MANKAQWLRRAPEGLGHLPDRLLLRDRSYDPDQRRFTTQDPMPAALDNPNKSPYTYADNDPSNLSDPSGNCPMCIGAGIGGVLGGGIYALTHRDDFDWGDFAGATAKGAVIGAGAGYLAPAGAGVASSLGLSGGRALAAAAATDAAIGMGYTTGGWQGTQVEASLITEILGSYGIEVRACEPRG
ncbi:RHS repeat-associated core domain-containing protein [Streptomyces rectiviolaceus]|uniref:RHS repeat-associated core domain-containing protein n=1 Tax=Streptomyces rectiviolaceus TaxID=332591 RepID=A0ABP6MLS0_9ACTN